MADLIVIRRGQASFGAPNYEVLSEMGNWQAVSLGQRLAALEMVPTGFGTVDMNRQRDTMDGLQTRMGLAAVTPQVHISLINLTLRACSRRAIAKPHHQLI